MNNFGQYKICVEKFPKEHLNHINNLKNISKSTAHFNKLKAAFLNGFNWTVGDVITIGFMGDGKNITRNTYGQLSITVKDKNQIDPLQKVVDEMSVIDGIKKIIQERIQPIANLKFEFVEDYKQAKIRISFDPKDGAWSVIGTQALSDDPDIKDKATMNLGWFDVSTTCHEFGHVLGLIHEHNNPKGNTIQWNKDAVYKWAQSTQGWDKQTTDENILQSYDISQINGSEFDPLSIMLYFYPPQLTLNNQGTQQTLRLSGNDVIYINKKYPGSVETPEEFYIKAFNESIQNNVTRSDKLKNFLNTNTNNYNYNYILYIIIGIIIILLCVYFWL